MAILLNSSGQRVLKDAGQRLGASGEACCCGFCPSTIKLTLSGCNAAATCNGDAQACDNGFPACYRGRAGSTLDGEYIISGGPVTGQPYYEYNGIFSVSVLLQFGTISGGVCSGSWSNATVTAGQFQVRIHCTTGEVLRVFMGGSAGFGVLPTAIWFEQGDLAAKYKDATNPFPTCAEAAAAHCIPLIGGGSWKVQNHS
jgi:hypothetical protein